MTSAQLSPPIIFIGLGNPGEKYNGSRHNVGHHFLDLLVEKYTASAFKSESKLFGSLSKASFESRKVLLFKSSKYMNESGESIRRFIDYYKLNLSIRSVSFTTILILIVGLQRLNSMEVMEDTMG